MQRETDNNTRKKHKYKQIKIDEKNKKILTIFT